MAYPPFPPTEGGEPSDATRGAGVPLDDAAQIAADPMDLNSVEALKDETLKDAVADVVANGTQDEIERLTSRIGAAQAAYAGPNGEGSSLPILAEPAKQTTAERTGGALLGLRGWSEARATVAAELADMQPQLLQSEQQQGGGTHWHPAKQQDAEPYQPAQQEPSEPVQVETPEPAVIAELPPAVPLVAETPVVEVEAAVEPPAAEPVAEPLVPEPPASEVPAPELPASELPVSELPLPEPVSAQVPDAAPDALLAGLSLAELTPAEPTQPEPARPQSLYARLEASLPEPPLPEPSHSEQSRPQSLSARLEAPLPEPPLPERPRPQLVREANVTPIASALDAAVKLAADADAAAAALENLSRMLQAHQRPASMVPSPGQHAALRPMHPAARTGAPDSRPMPMPPRSVMPDGDPLQMSTPRPEHRPMKRMLPPVAPVEVPVARPVRPPTLRPTLMPRDTRHFDLRGFMAGFAVAGALGALLYIFLMTG